MNRFFFSEDNEVLGNKYDIVCFLYSVILTRGPNRFVTKKNGSVVAALSKMIRDVRSNFI